MFWCLLFVGWHLSISGWNYQILFGHQLFRAKNCTMPPRQMLRRVPRNKLWHRHLKSRGTTPTVVLGCISEDQKQTSCTQLWLHPEVWLMFQNYSLVFLSSPILVLYHPRRHHRKSLKLLKKTMFSQFSHPPGARPLRPPRQPPRRLRRPRPRRRPRRGWRAMRSRSPRNRRRCRGRSFGGVAVEVFLDGDPGTHGKLGGRCSWLHC